MEIWRILQEESDEEHPLSIQAIHKKLEQRCFEEIRCDKRTIRSDIEVLQELGFDIIEIREKHNTSAFYLSEMYLDLNEIRMILDILASARFLSKVETERLSKKLSRLVSCHQAKSLQNLIQNDQSIKLDYHLLFHNLGYIHSGLRDQKKICFQYGTYDVHKQFNLHRNGEFYEAIPIQLLWHNDFYYLVAKEQVRGQTQFRVDRIRKIRVIEEEFEPIPFDAVKFLKQNLNMFTGTQIETVKLRIHNSLLNPVIDRFGLEADIKVESNEYFIFRSNLSINEGLITWIMGWGSNVVVLEPEHLVDKIKKQIELMSMQYK